MNLGPKNNIDIYLLKRYYDGSLTAAEKNALEQESMDNPLLHEAMEGFEAVPGSFENYYAKHQKLIRKSSGGYFIIGGVLTIALVSFLVVFNDKPEHFVENNVQTSIDTGLVRTEVIVVPQEIDTLVEVVETEIIKATEIVSHKKEIQKSIKYAEKEGEQPIVILEDIKVNEDFKIIEEERNYNLVELVPATYLFDLFVVDYRRIKRERSNIIYTKYELSGVSAEFENSDRQNNTDLIEKQVDVPYFDFLRSAMELFAHGDYKKALTKYTTILEQYPPDANALFYGGLCYYNLKKYDKSIEFFDKILNLQLNAFKEEAKWYKIKSLLKQGNNGQAKTLLDEVISAGGHYAPDAIQLKKSL